MNDLTERLRDGVLCFADSRCKTCAAIIEAADRINELEAAARRLLESVGAIPDEGEDMVVHMNGTAAIFELDPEAPHE